MPPITINQTLKCREGKKTIKRPVVYVQLPRKLLTHPPIRHRASAQDTGLTVFEFAIAGACAALAISKIAEARHAAAKQGGLKAIKEQRKKPSKDMATLRLSSGVNYEFHMAGASGYHQAREAFNQSSGNPAIMVETSRSTLLRTAGLSRKAEHIRKLPHALTRLKKPVGALPPLLVMVKSMSSGLQLTISGEWLPKRRYGRVPWPLPKNGSTVLALYLFLCALNYDSNSTRRASIRVSALCQRIGIPLTYNAHVRRAIDRALAAVNAHLRRLNDGSLRTHKLNVEFEIRSIGGDGTRVRFSALDDAEARRKSREQKQQAVSDSKSDAGRRHDLHHTPEVVPAVSHYEVVDEMQHWDVSEEMQRGQHDNGVEPMHGRGQRHVEAFLRTLKDGASDHIEKLREDIDKRAEFKQREAERTAASRQRLLEAREKLAGKR